MDIAGLNTMAWVVRTCKSALALESPSILLLPKKTKRRSEVINPRERYQSPCGNPKFEFNFGKESLMANQLCNAGAQCKWMLARLAFPGVR
jgi:hypothetical protein